MFEVLFGNLVLVLTHDKFVVLLFLFKHFLLVGRGFSHFHVPWFDPRSLELDFVVPLFSKLLVLLRRVGVFHEVCKRVHIAQVIVMVTLLYLLAFLQWWCLVLSRTFLQSFWRRLFHACMRLYQYWLWLVSSVFSGLSWILLHVHCELVVVLGFLKIEEVLKSTLLHEGWINSVFFVET